MGFSDENRIFMKTCTFLPFYIYAGRS